MATPPDCFCPSALAHGLRAPRLLIVPGLHDSGTGHWQTWLQGLVRHSVRVQQDDWHHPDLDAWSRRIGDTLDAAGPGPWLVAAHSFGVLALVHHLATQQARGAEAGGPHIAGALLVAPAEPARFGLEAVLSPQPLPTLSTLVASDTDPWMSADSAHRWARRWGCHWVNLGDVGHINTEAGFGPLPFARRWVLAMTQRLARERRGLVESGLRVPPPPARRAVPASLPRVSAAVGLGGWRFAV